MAWAGVALAGKAAGSAKRSSGAGWCSSRLTAMNGSMPFASQAPTFLAL